MDITFGPEMGVLFLGGGAVVGESVFLAGAGTLLGYDGIEPGSSSFMAKTGATFASPGGVAFDLSHTVAVGDFKGDMPLDALIAGELSIGLGAGASVAPLVVGLGTHFKTSPDWFLNLCKGGAK